jgi:hypothetical protein
MSTLKWLYLAASLALALAGTALAADPPPRFAMARALSAGTPELAAPNLEGGVSLVTVTVGGAIEVLD